MQTQVLEANFYSLLEQASIPAKLVLLVLLLFSIASWAIIINKRRAFRRAAQQSRDFLEIFRRLGRWSDIHPHCDRFDHCPLVSLFLAAYNHLGDRTSNEEERVEPDSQSVTSVERVIKQAALIELERMENSLSWLASIATSAPFIGLFGTVVGIIISFQGLSVQTQTSIQAVAPGIAEALIATAAGLFVAVPAYIAYNYFVSEVRRLAGLLDSFSLELLNGIERSLTQYGIFRS
jgi:biopolymer transport protein TolQ